MRISPKKAAVVALIAVASAVAPPQIAEASGLPQRTAQFFKFFAGRSPVATNDGRPVGYWERLVLSAILAASTPPPAISNQTTSSSPVS